MRDEETDEEKFQKKSGRNIYDQGVDKSPRESQRVRAVMHEAKCSGSSVDHDE
jgi:hypothetical protein